MSVARGEVSGEAPAVELTLLERGALVGVAFAAGVVDAIAGGGGVLTLPSLLACDLPLHQALGTNKGQSVFGSFASMLRFWRGGLIDGKRARWSFPFGLMGAFAGAALVLAVRPQVLRPLVLVLLVAVALFLALRRPTAPEAGAPAPLLALNAPRAQAIAALIALGLGAYDGFFGPGTGTFLIALFVALLGDSISRASANAKVVNFASNLASVAMFAQRGVILWSVALPMAAAQFAGGTLGAHLAIRRGDVLVRRVVLGVVLVLVIKLARDLAAAA